MSDKDLGDGAVAPAELEASEVGYKRPPMATRFQPGRSGNPKGRPKATRNLATIIAAAVAEKVAITENGRRKRITKLDAAVKQLANHAASGERHATQQLLSLLQANEGRGANSAASPPSDADDLVMQELARRMTASRARRSGAMCR